MLSEEAIDKLIEPFTDRQEAVNNYIVNLIAERIKEAGSMRASDIAQLKRLVQYGADIRKINQAISENAGIQVKNVKKLIKIVAMDTYQDAKPFYDYRHKSFIPLEKNEPLQKMVSAISKQTVGTFKNISDSRATGFLMPSRKNSKKLVFKSIPLTYQEIIDEAIQASLSGVDTRVAIRRALKQLADSGIRRVSWDSGYTQRLDTAVRRNILDGINAVRQQMEDEIGRQIGADGKELSAHEYSALDHEAFQGHIFTNKQWDRLQTNKSFQDVKGRKFKAVKRVIGQWNCRHFAYSIIIDAHKPRYSDAELQNNIRRNHRGYRLSNGKRLTMYECTQYQRRLETQIRYAKEGQIAARHACDKVLAGEYQAKASELMKQLKQFCKNTGLPFKKDRVQVSGYHLISP